MARVIFCRLLVHASNKNLNTRYLRILKNKQTWAGLNIYINVEIKPVEWFNLKFRNNVY